MRRVLLALLICCLPVQAATTALVGGVRRNYDTTGTNTTTSAITIDGGTYGTNLNAGSLYATSKVTIATLTTNRVMGAGDAKNVTNTFVPVPQLLSLPLTPQMYDSAAGGGTADDTAAFQAMFDHLSVYGGEAFIPTVLSNGAPARYSIRTLLLTNALPVTIRSAMVGYDKTTSSCILPRVNTTYLIQVKSPTANRDLAGGVTFDGLAFKDATASNGLPGSITMDAAIYIKDGIKSHVQNCSFENIKGSAIKTGYFIQSTIESVAIRYCGSTGHSALDLSGDSSSFPSQSVVVANSSIEACYSAPYVNAGLYLIEGKFIGLGFEADSAADSNWPFIQTEDGAHGLLIDVCHFNRNNTNQIRITTNCYGINIAQSSFRGSITTNCAVYMGGNDCTLGGQSFFNSGKTLYEVELRGLRNTLADSTFLNSGSIYASGTDANVTGNHFAGSLGGGSSAYVIDLQGSNGSAIGNDIHVTSGPGGIRAVSATGQMVHDNHVNGTLGVGFRNESSGTVATGNSIYNNSGGDFTTASPLAAGVSEFNFFSSAPYLEMATVCNPPQLGPFESAQVFVTLTGVSIGDYVDVSLTTLPDNIMVTANVTGNNRVQVTFHNASTSPVDVSSGTLYVRARKTWAPATTATNTPTGGFDAGGTYVTGTLLRNGNFVNGADITPALASGTNLSFVLGTTGVGNGTYGAATKTVQFTVDTKGRITAASEFSPTNYVELVLGNPNSAAVTGSTNLWVAPEASTLKKVTVHLLKASSSGSVTIDLKKNGTTMLSAPVSMAAGATNATATVSVTSISALDRLAAEITAAGTDAYGTLLNLGVTTP